MGTPAPSSKEEVTGRKTIGNYCEWGVVTFAGDTSGGVLEEVWLKEPHFYAVFSSGFCGQNHENITIRNVKITDISQDIPQWDQMSSIGRSIDMGATVPEYGMGGPSGTVTIEGLRHIQHGYLCGPGLYRPRHRHAILQRPRR